MPSRLSWVVACGLLLGLTSTAAADDGELRLMSESIGYMSVADAADGDDPFDFNLSIGYRWARSSGSVERETFGDPPNRLPRMTGVGDYVATWNYLDVKAEIGIYHDFALRVHLPVLLSYDQSIKNIDGAAAGGHLGSDDAVSPTRSGIPEVIVGLAWAPMNQFRRADRPTWLWIFNVALPVGSVMRPCLAEDDCDDAGVTQGVVRLLPEMRLSRRFRHVEAYGAFFGDIPFVTKAEDLFTPAGNLSGYQKTRPSIQGLLTMGFTIIPWEQRATHQRLAIDLRFLGGYVSSGRNFSPLFDVLGSRNSLPSICPNGADAVGGACPVGAPTPFTGLTDTEAYGTLGGRLTLEVKAARYVTFFLSGGYQMHSRHLVTYADECNGSASSPGDTPDVDAIGCHFTDAAPNPHYQEALDGAGSRFGMGSINQFDLQIRAQGTF